MRNLLRFIVQYHFIFLFVLIESLSLVLLFGANPYQKYIFYRFSHNVTNRISLKANNIKDYLSLYYENKKLVEENTRLYNLLSSSFPAMPAETADRITQDIPGTYRYISARIINSSVNKQNNFITIDKGSRDDIEPDMAVICSDGIVGLTKSVSKNFTVVLPALNIDFQLSGKIKRNGYFGPVTWNGSNATFITLADIPHHVEISKGDTVITSGYGARFPEGYMIGLIEDFRLKGGNYYEINIRLSTDFRKLNYVQVIEYLAKQEVDSLQNSVQND